MFTHEYTHILHLDRTRGFMQGVRRIFGRVPVAFPNAFLPLWQIEGLATFEESRMTGQGRVPAGDFRAIVDVAAAQGRFEPIDRASGGHHRLAGRQRALRLRRATFTSSSPIATGRSGWRGWPMRRAGRVPFFGAGAFKNVFGRSSPDLWNDFRAAREARRPRERRPTRGRRRLTHHGFTVTAPRVAGRRRHLLRGGEPARLPRADAAAGRAAQPARVAWRASGAGHRSAASWIVFDQIERVRSVALYSDLFAVRDGTAAAFGA